MAFRNERFPDAISYDAIERVRHNTSVIRVQSGARAANKNWAFPLREFDVSHVMRLKSYMDTVVAFNLAVAEGMANNFRYKAWADYKALSTEGIATLISGDTYQMYKRYTFGAYTKDRKITLPVSGTIAIAGGSLMLTQNFTVQANTPRETQQQFASAAYQGGVRAYQRNR